ncbi:hypothetical protein NB640_04955 [Oxalobacter vibrioformis]|uniref:Uncharacterized protein n=1 Tax=Oxalobacter vibrioformis TaxID=933080 RepID=A0A9E9LXB1_9BURK|nr:hypothetical protein [Oxalobacter vibrioformis]WAW10986.1 hypothetical protein NB640_04955 [Oxalobacter vibrioformis]
MKSLLKIFLIAFFSSISLSHAQTLIPRSEASDKGTYYLLAQKKKGNVINTLHKRVGVDSVGYTRSEINCQTMKMRVIGYSERSPDSIKRQPTEWFDLVPGSSKSDLANFVCFSR